MRLYTLRLGRCPLSKMAEDAAPQGGTAPNLEADVQIEATQVSSPALRNRGNSARAATLIPATCLGSKMLLSPEFRLSGQRGHDFTGGDYRVGEGRTVELGRVHLFPAFSRRRIFD
jgi:hypothetical protein